MHIGGKVHLHHVVSSPHVCCSIQQREEVKIAAVSRHAKKSPWRDTARPSNASVVLHTELN